MQKNVPQLQKLCMSFSAEKGNQECVLDSDEKKKIAQA